MVQNSRSFLLLPSRFGSAAKSPLSPKSNLQIINYCEAEERGIRSAEFPDRQGNFPKPLPFLALLPLPRSPTSSTELGVRHSVRRED